LGRFVVRHERATTDILEHRPWPEPAVRSVWFVEVDRPTLVLGSTQSDEVVDRRRAEAAGVDVVRRRSGGGAVLLRPGETVWADVLLPAGDPLAEADVGRAFGWVGEAWATALVRCGVAGTIVHRGRPRASAWSDLVCFAGLGLGEVTVGGAKVVGISQRRTRAGALFQCGALVAWEPDPLFDVLVLSDEDRSSAAVGLVHLAAGTGVEPSRLVSAFEDALNGP
jgi:lipoate-protein ligase A